MPHQLLSRYFTPQQLPVDRSASALTTDSLVNYTVIERVWHREVLDVVLDFLCGELRTLGEELTHTDTGVTSGVFKRLEFGVVHGLIRQSDLIQIVPCLEPPEQCVGVRLDGLPTVGT